MYRGRTAFGRKLALQEYDFSGDDYAPSPSVLILGKHRIHLIYVYKKEELQLQTPQ